MKSTLDMKPTAAKKKITIRRTGDVRLTAAPCNCPYYINV